MGYYNLDLSGIDEIVIGAEAPSRVYAAGGIIDVRLDSPDGILVGATEKAVPVEIDFRTELRKLRAAWEKSEKKGPAPNFRMVRNMFRPKFAVKVNGAKGKHNIYFVFKNVETKNGQVLLQINEIEFKNGASNPESLTKI